MSRFVKSVHLFLASITPFVAKTADASITSAEVLSNALNEPQAVPLRPLNFAHENLFAGHRSHSSHRSHYSGSSGRTHSAPARVAPPARAPAPTVQTPRTTPGSSFGAGGAAPASRSVIPVVPMVPNGFRASAGRGNYRAQ